MPDRLDRQTLHRAQENVRAATHKLNDKPMSYSANCLVIHPEDGCSAIKVVVPPTRVELVTFGLQNRCSTN